jgi:hypothetical protein
MSESMRYVDDWEDDDDFPQIRYWNVGDDGTVTDAEPPPDLGPCCACGKAGLMVRNIIMLPVRGPADGNGWGCFQCGLPMEGAVAVLCDACLESEAEILQVCVGYPYLGHRQARKDFTEPFEHDMSKHPEAA